MARLFHAGAEINAGAGTAAQNTGPDGLIAGTVTRDTTTFNAGGGVASWKCDAGASNLAATMTFATTFVDGNTYFLRSYFRAAAPFSGVSGRAVMLLGVTGGTDATVNVNGTTGTARVVLNGAAGAVSANVCDGNWHYLELKAVAAATGNWTSAELKVDGTVIGSVASTVARGGNSCQVGQIVANGANYVMNFDDIALNDSTGAANNGYPGAGAVVLLKPTADSAVGTGWTTSSASGSGLFNNVNITPPAGIADTTASNLHQIRNATSNANVSYDATMTTYTAAGVGSKDTVNAVVEVVATAAPVTTSAKQGTFGIVSNPTVANVALNATGTSGAFWAGATAGTFGAGWKWSTGAYQNAPTVTFGTAPVARITQVTSSTRIAMCCAMFIYVDYTPFVSTVHVRNPAINFADPAFV